MKKTRIGLPVAISALLVGFAASPSQAAAQHYASCSTSPAGASGSVSTSGWDYGDRSIPSLAMKVYDEASDGNHVQIRLVASYADTFSYFPWHSDYDGYGTYKEFDSSVPKGGNIFDVGIQVAVYDGSKQIRHCTKWVSGSTKDPS
ncbi:hypothetical protein [Streptomyces barringtoniae]|uniref:hypothetical protein n=1 Tax=Streptomyces barringtoniae TaxID=2892029 RepID=UPI001E53035F|nr:hypothetical protein [Streptomyces barringtoniae]MCC5477209.1 hypothetical protein [Streptomyces barringtoniae]